MSARPGDLPALESGMPSGFFYSLSNPMGMARRTYDENLDVPLNSPPPDMSVNILWKDPVIPRHRFKKLPEEGERHPKPPALELGAPAVAPRSPAPVVRAKATSLMSSLMIKQSHDSLQRFEHQAGLTDDVYSPHKGLSAEETRSARLADGTVPKLRMPSGELKEDRPTASSQSTPYGTPCVTPSVTPCVTPCVSPHSSPVTPRRSWFGSSNLLSPPELGSHSPSFDMGGNEGGGGGGGGGGVDRWSFFGPRPVVQKSPTDPGSDSGPGFTLQTYFGLQKSTTMDAIKTQVHLKVDDPATFLPPKMDLSGLESRHATQRPHKLKPRDMNVLTPSGF
ncbi:putative monooxygenase p33MONOX [Gadus morhua]|uniref:putative monooxygenase p33MONOX n=1 Tax=Gadus morhua TaxID=8049 RepID=UPI0011B55A66|nr:putative monooxygenase p33MONOX [Gadus morhua]XP_030224654.1 putative monooxygenase p33MONOX [Gadus morhua]